MLFLYFSNMIFYENSIKFSMMDELVANPCDGRFERFFFHLTLCWYYLSLKWQQKLWWRVFNAHSHTPICLSISHQIDQSCLYYYVSFIQSKVNYPLILSTRFFLALISNCHGFSFMFSFSFLKMHWSCWRQMFPIAEVSKDLSSFFSLDYFHFVQNWWLWMFFHVFSSFSQLFLKSKSTQ